MNRRTFNRLLGGILCTAPFGIPVLRATPIETVKVGILHSLSGTMSISEQVLKDVALMTIGEINKSGGVLGKYLDPVVLDPASNWDAFERKADKLLNEFQVAAIFGCWTSVSRKRVLPVVEKNNGLLFYPVQYEGQEQSSNIFYTGATPNQQAIPSVNYFLKELGFKKFILLGTDYVYPRTANKILRAYLNSEGINDASILEKYTPFSHRQYQSIIEQIERFSKDEKTLVVSTINGDSNLAFYEQLYNQGLDADRLPVLAFSIGEFELSQMDTKYTEGHYAAWNYFMSLNNERNSDFINRWRVFLQDRIGIRQDNIVVNDPMEATYLGIHIWKQAVEKAKSFEVDKVIPAVGGVEMDALSGYRVRMDDENHHLHKPAMLGKITKNGQFEIVWNSDGLVQPNPWNRYISDRLQS
jgi:urea transport system substrate-binding protein